MKTLIAVPCHDQVDALFARSLAQLVRVGDTEVEFRIGTLIPFARDILAGKALQNNFDFILWLDADMVFSPDLMIRLSSHMTSGLDLVTGIYHQRRPPYAPVIYRTLREPETDGERITEQYLDYPKDKLFEIEGCGFGGCMMRTSVIPRIMDEHKALFSMMQGVGEDLSFCCRARKSGVRMWADPTIQMGHRGYLVSDWEQFEAWKAIEKAQKEQTTQE